MQVVLLQPDGYRAIYVISIFIRKGIVINFSGIKVKLSHDKVISHWVILPNFVGYLRTVSHRKTVRNFGV